jgi:hypothetical protein
MLMPLAEPLHHRAIACKQKNAAMMNSNTTMSKQHACQVQKCIMLYDIQKLCCTHTAPGCLNHNLALH